MSESSDLVERLAEKHWGQWAGSGPLTERNAKRQVRFLLHAIADELEKAFHATIAGEAHWLRRMAEEPSDG